MINDYSNARIQAILDCAKCSIPREIRLNIDQSNNTLPDSNNYVFFLIEKSILWLIFLLQYSHSHGVRGDSNIQQTRVSNHYVVCYHILHDIVQ
jgi:hypothetical protein